MFTLVLEAASLLALRAQGGVNRLGVLTVLERDLEKMFRNKVHMAGGVALKWVSPGWRGAPDRIVIFPGGRLAFAELKAPGRRPSPLQRERIRFLRSMGFDVWVIDRKEDIQKFVEEMTK